MPSSTSTALPTTTETAVSGANWESEEWELINDDGFVYRRKKRQIDTDAVAGPLDPVSNPELEAKWKRGRTQNTLLKLKEKYQRELFLWDKVSNTLRTMEEILREEQERKERYEEGREKRREEVQERLQNASVAENGSSCVDELVCKVQEQEAIIRHVTHLCDAAEDLCDAQEERVVKSYIDLPIWGSPRELMAALCDD